MKKLVLIAAAVLLYTVAAYPQGAVNFSTKAGTSTATAPGWTWAPVYLPEPSDTGTQRYGNTATGVPAGTQTYSGGYVIGTGYTAQLWGGAAGTAANDLALVSTTTMRTQTATTVAGTVNPPTTAPTVAGVPGGSQATFQLRVWDNRGGATSWAQATAGTLAFGASRTFTPPFPLQVPPTTPPNLQGLESFSLMIVPEPSAIALGVLGVGALVLFRRDRKSVV